jgi:hypothetical protein
MSDEPSPSEFLISKMEGMDDVTQVLIVTRTGEGEISYDSCGQIAADTLGMIEFVRVAAAEHLRRELYARMRIDFTPSTSCGVPEIRCGYAIRQLFALRYPGFPVGLVGSAHLMRLSLEKAKHAAIAGAAQ